MTDSEHVLPPMPPMGDEEDFVGEGLSDALEGATIDYTYSRGNHYQLVFDHNHHVVFHYLNAPPMPDGSHPDFTPPSLAYRARELRKGQYLVHWIVKPPSIHVSLVIDLEEKKVYSAAMMPPNRWEFFDSSEIHSVTYD